MIEFKYPEGATPIDFDEAEGLLLTHITTLGELNRWEQDNILEAKTWIGRTKPSNILNEKFIKNGNIQQIDSFCRNVFSKFSPLKNFISLSAKFFNTFSRQ